MQGPVPNKIEELVEEGLISPEQAEAAPATPVRQVRADEILVYLPLTSIARSISSHLCGSAVLFTFVVWLDDALWPRDFHTILLVLAIGLIAGGLWLALSEWHRAKGRKGLVTVS